MLEELFSTWVGQLSLLVLVFIIGMGGYMYRMMMRNIRADALISAQEAAQDAAQEIAPEMDVLAQAGQTAGAV